MKVNLSSNRIKKNPFRFSFDSSVTAKYGEVLPISSVELVPETNVKHDIRSAVRFAPLSLPTFGKSFLKTYYCKQRISDIYEPFDNMLSQTPYQGAGETYIPKEVPNVDPYFLLGMLLANSTVSAYFIGGISDSVTSSNSIFRTDYGQIHPVLFDNTTLYENQSLFYSFLVCSIYSELSNNNSADIEYAKRAYEILALLDSSNSTSQLQYAYGYDFTGQVNYITKTDANEVLQNNVNNLITPNNCDYITTSLQSGSNVSNPLNPFTHIKFSTNGQKSFIVYSSDDSSGYNTTDKGMMFCWRLNNTGKFIRKILIGLGYKIACVNGRVSLIPLMSYYKSYFDLFAPKRFIKYSQTNAYKLINYCVQYGVSFYTAINGTFASVANNSNYYKNGPIFRDFVTDLSRCYYTEDTDYYSSQIIGLSNVYGDTLSQSYLGQYNSGQEHLDSIEQPNSNSVPLVDLSGNNSHTQVQQNILSRLTNLVNRRSLLGGKIFEYLKSTFGIKMDVDKSIDNDSSYISSDSLDVEFSDVFSTAETSEGTLGEYAGKSVAAGYGNGITYDTDQFTYIITLGVIVPRTQYVQGIEPCLRHIGYSDFYNSSFDGLTLIPSRRDEFVCPQFGFYDKYANIASSFGNKPLYSEYKTKQQGVLNGDLSLNSTVNTYDSFTLDRKFTDRVFSDIINYPESGQQPNSSNLKLEYRTYLPNMVNVTAGVQWRYVGLYKQYGNFDRIFVNSGVIDNYNSLHAYGFESNPYINKESRRDYYRDDDNLIIHYILDYKLNSPMLSSADSYLTKDLEDLYNSNADGMKVSAE